MVFKGYTDAAATAEAFDDDGWFRTGDLGHLRADGHVVLTGRLKDIIIRKGENIAAKEIEDLLYAHPKVGRRGRDRPARPRAWRAGLRGGRAGGRGQGDLTFDEMVETLTAAQLMRQKIPEQLEVVDALPRNETLRKILKFKLPRGVRRQALAVVARERSCPRSGRSGAMPTTTARTLLDGDPQSTCIRSRYLLHGRARW